MARGVFTDPGFITGAISLILNAVGLGFMYKQLSEIQDQLLEHGIKLEAHAQHLEPLVDNDVLSILDNLMVQIQAIEQRINVLHIGMINSTQWMQNCREKLKETDVALDDATNIYSQVSNSMQQSMQYQQPMQQVPQYQQPMQLQQPMQYQQPMSGMRMQQPPMSGMRSGNNRSRRMRTREELNSLRR